MEYSNFETPTPGDPPSTVESEMREEEVMNCPPWKGPVITNDEVGGVSSSRRRRLCTASTFPTLSSLNHCTRCSASPARVNGPEYETHGPESKRYCVRRIPCPLRSTTESVRGVEEVT